MNRVEIKRKQIQTILCIIGVAAWLIMSRFTGMEGLGYLAVAVELLWLMIILTSAAIPDALGRLLWSRKSRLQYKNEKIIRRSALLLQGIAGIVGSIILFLTAGIVSETLFHVPYSMLSVRILSAAVLFRALSAVLLGYFQGEGNMMPSIIITALRQVLYLGFGILFAGSMGKYGGKVALLVRKEEMTAMYAAAGIAAAVVLAELLLLIFAAFIGLTAGKKRKDGDEGMKRTETLATAAGSLYRSAGPDMLMYCLLGIPVLTGSVLYFRQEAASAVEFGVFFGGCLVLCAIPVLLISSVTHGLTAKAIGSLRKEEKKYARDLLGGVLHYLIIAGLFASVFLTALAGETAHMFVADTASAVLLKGMLQKGASVILFVLLSVFFLRVLSMLGRGLTVLLSGAVFCLVYLISAVISVIVMKAGISGLLVSGLLASLAMCVVSGFFAMRLVRLKIDLLYWIAVPCLSVLVCGLVWMLLSKYGTPRLGFAVTAGICLVVGTALYWLIQLLLRSFSRLELETIPGNRFLKMMKEFLPFG